VNFGTHSAFLFSGLLVLIKRRIGVPILSLMK
jgi:hypothetical protein